MTLWKTISINSKLYLIKYVNTDNNLISCSFSDFKNMWKEELDVTSILERAKNLNPLLENDKQTVMDKIVSLGIDYQLEDLSSNNELMKFKIKYYITSVPFQFFWKLKQCSQDVFFSEITKSLLVSLIKSLKKQNELKESIRRKDIEIAQYKIEGANLIRKHVSTVPFDENEFDKKYQAPNVDLSFVNLVKDTTQLDHLQELCGIELFCERNYVANSSNQNGCTSTENRLVSPAKRDTKKSLSRSKAAIRKFETKPSMKLVYDNNDDADDTDESDAYEDNVNKDTDTSVDKTTTTISPPKRSKIRKTKINL